jgi:YVTN family beta-propeller protein
MSPRELILPVAILAVATAGTGFVLRHGAEQHMRRMSGWRDTSKANCFNCHGVSTNRLAWAKPRPRHAAPAGLAVSPDGRRLYVALDDRDELVEIDPATRRVTRTVRVESRPTGLALDPRGDQLYVTCRNNDRVAVVNTRTFTETGAIPVGLGPVGIALFPTRAGDRLVVADAGSDEVSILSAAELREVARLAAGREPFAVVPTADGTRALLANRLAALTQGDAVPVSELTVINPETGRVLAREALVSAHLCESVAPVPGRSLALTPLVKVRNLVPITQVARGWVMSSGLAVTDLNRNTTVQVPLDEANDYFADPSGIAVDRAGKRAYVASGGSDVVTIIDLDRLEHWLARADDAARREAIDNLELSAEYVVGRIHTGRNPRQVLLSPDDRTLYVAERLDDSILMVDTRSARPIGRIRLGDDGSNDPIRRGERLFTRAANTFQHQFSCRSCHPDGHVDGLTYDFDVDGIGRNIVDNRSLQGLAGTAPFKWNGKNASLQVQCGPRFARVLMRTEPFPKSDLDDLAAYLESLPPSRTVGNRGAPLTVAQERGRKIFLATETTGGRPIPRAR